MSFEMNLMRHTNTNIMTNIYLEGKVHYSHAKEKRNYGTRCAIGA